MKYLKPTLCFFVVLAVLLVSAYFMDLVWQNPDLRGEGLVRYLWAIPLIAMTIGFGYIFASLINAMGRIHEFGEHGLATLTKNWPESVRRLIGIRIYKSKNDD